MIIENRSNVPDLMQPPDMSSSISIRSENEQDYNTNLWYWDTGSDTQVVGCKDYYVEYHEMQIDESQGAISGFTSEFHTKAEWLWNDKNRS